MIRTALATPAPEPAATDPGDLTGYWAPDPPIRCLTATTPPAPVVLRDPCPRCEGSPALIPRHLMAGHMRDEHDEEQPGA